LQQAIKNPLEAGLMVVVWQVFRLFAGIVAQCLQGKYKNIHKIRVVNNFLIVSGFNIFFAIAIVIVGKCAAIIPPSSRPYSSGKAFLRF
jgi:hypothetical protein